MAIKRSIAAPALLAALIAGNAWGHSDGDQPLFVAPDGVDNGLCQDELAPCQTIGYAVSKVGKGGQIRVASGSYTVTDLDDIFYLINGSIDIRGGYGVVAHDRSFATGAATGTSTIIGVPLEYADTLSQRGFHVVVDRKGIDRQTATETRQRLAVHESLKSSMSRSPCVGGFANGLACDDVDLLSHVASTDISANPGAAADVWGFVDLNTNREYAIIGFDIGTAVFDVTDAENPREVGFIDGQQTVWRDIKVYQFWNASDDRWNAHAYITADGAGDGLFVIDLSELPHRVTRLGYQSDFAAAHNVYATNTDFGTGLSLTGAAPTLVVAGSDNGAGPYRAYTIGNPGAPQFAVMPGSGRDDYMHDAASMIITDNRKDTQCVNASTYCEVLFDFNELTFDIWDITDAANPVQLSRTNYPNVSYVHSGWWSEDKQYLFVHDELDERNFGLNSTLRVYSLANLGAPTVAGDWIGPTRAIDHNGFVRGNRYYMSNYSRGLTILDISDAGNPATVGRIDTFPGSDSDSFVGAWGTFPYLHSGNIAISDINSGFYMVADRTLDVTAGKLALAARSFGGEEGTQLSIPVSRVGGSSGAVSVAYEIVPATGSADDFLTTSGTLNWADGDTADKTIALDLQNDASAESLERILLRLVAPTAGATLASANVASVYISDAGQPASIEFSDSVVQVPERGFATAVAVIQRSGSAVGAVSVDYALSGGDADAGVDFQGATSGTVSWMAGDADPKWIEFAITDDGSGESTEFFELTLSNASGAVIGAKASLRIEISDGVSGVNSAPNAVAGASQTVTAGTTVTLDGRQSNDPDGDNLSYAWQQAIFTNDPSSVPTVVLNNANSARASFVAPDVTSDTLLQFSLTVTDSGGLSSSAITSVTVNQAQNRSSGGGSINWLGLLLLGALLFKRVLNDNRLTTIRSG